MSTEPLCGRMEPWWCAGSWFMVVLLRCIVNKAIFLLVLLLLCGTSAQSWAGQKGLENCKTLTISCVDRRGISEWTLPFAEMRGEWFAAITSSSWPGGVVPKAAAGCLGEQGLPGFLLARNGQRDSFLPSSKMAEWKNWRAWEGLCYSAWKEKSDGYGKAKLKVKEKTSRRNEGCCRIIFVN